MPLAIMVLGSGCRNCLNLEANVKEAVNQLGLEAAVEKVTDYGAMLSMGVMRTPGLVINGEVKSVGRVPSVDEIKALLRN